MYNRILVPTDGSNAVPVSLDHAISIAKANTASIYSVYVIDSRITRAADQSARDDLESKLADEGSAAISRVVTTANEAGIDAQGEVIQGTPSTQIVKYAEANAIDLIVIGSTGKTPREKVSSLGSVSERVVADAPVSVLVARGTTTTAE